MRYKSCNIFSLLALCLLLMTVGCGYTTGSLHDTQYQTIAVPIFKNQTFYRGFEHRLTEAVKKEIETKTPYKIVNREEADTLLTGEIVGVQQPVLTDTALATVAEFQLVITVQIRWKDMKTGKILKDLPVTNRTNVDTRRGQTIETAQEDMFTHLAELIVEELEKEW